MKEIVTAQKEQVDASISGMGTLKSSMLATQTLVNSMSSGSRFTSNTHQIPILCVPLLWTKHLLKEALIHLKSCNC